MRYLNYTYVDAVSGIPINEVPAQNGPKPPSVAGLQFVFAQESQYPTLVPMLYGTCPDAADINTPGVLAELTDAEFAATMAAETVLAQARITAEFEQAIQAKLDAAAFAARYDSIATAVSYAEEPAVPKFRNDGKAFRAWRSLVWAYAYAQLDAVKSGQRPQPTVGEFLLELPALELPV